MRPMARIDERACAAHGDCLDVAPNAFALSDDDDVAIATGSAPADVLVRAAEACPSVAISVIDADSGEQLYP
jgi:ferredoxin